MMRIMDEAVSIIQAGKCCGGKTETMFSRVPTEAKRICQRCPVIEVCLWKAMVTEQGQDRHLRFGVYGGADRLVRARLGSGLPASRIADHLEKAIWRYRSGSLPVMPDLRHSGRRGLARDAQITEARASASAMARTTGVSRRVLVGYDRDHAQVRAVIMMALRMHGYSYPVIGAAMERDHSSVMSACRRVNRRADLAESAAQLAALD